VSKKQATVALPSSEAEYAAASLAACQAIWTRRVLEDLHQIQEKPTVIHCDNIAAISMTKNPVFHERSKHIDILHHFIRDIVAEGKIAMKYCSTNVQVADGFTNALPYSKFIEFRSSLGVSVFASRGSDKY
jgi:hypothetical protein